MSRIFGLEVKRLLKAKNNNILILLAIFISATLALCSGFVENSTIINADGTIKRIHGIEAIKNNRKIEKSLNGAVTPEKFMQTIRTYQTLHEKYGDVIPDEAYVREITPISEILYLIPYIFPDSDGSASTRIFYELPIEKAATFYEQRTERQKLYWTMELEHDKIALQHVQERETLVKKPFYFHSYSGWDTAGEYLGVCIIIITFLCCIIAAPVFAGEYQNESDMILRTTRYGRKQLAIAKFTASLFVSALLYMICMIIYIGICYWLFGAEGLQTSVQFINLLSSSPYTIGSLNLLTLLGGLLVITTMVAFTLFISARCSAPIIVIVKSVAMLALPIFLKIVVGNFSFINTISNILPSSGTGIYYELVQIDYLRIGSWSIWSPYIIAFTSLLYTILFFILCIWSYNRYEVK